MTTPQYNPNIPNSKDYFASSQDQFLTNFSQLYEVFGKNHVALDAVSNAGNHTNLQLYQQTGKFQTNAGEISVYSRIANQNTPENPDNTAQIYIENQGGKAEYQYTAYQIYSVKTTDPNKSYFTFLPNRIIVYFGLINAARIGVQGTILDLVPPIATKILTANFTAQGTSVQSTCSYNIPAASGKYFQKIEVFPPSGRGGSLNYFYMVMATI